MKPNQPMVKLGEYYYPSQPEASQRNLPDIVRLSRMLDSLTYAAKSCAVTERALYVEICTIHSQVKAMLHRQKTLEQSLTTDSYFSLFANGAPSCPRDH